MAGALLRVYAHDARVGVQFLSPRRAGAEPRRVGRIRRPHRKGQTRGSLSLGVLPRHIRRHFPLFSHLGSGLFRQAAVVGPRAYRRTGTARRRVRVSPQSLQRQGSQSRGVRHPRAYDCHDGHIRALYEPARPPRGGQAVGRTRRISFFRRFRKARRLSQRAHSAYGRYGVCGHLRLQLSHGQNAHDKHPQHRLHCRKRRDNGKLLRRVPRVFPLAFLYAYGQILLARISRQRRLPHHRGKHPLVPHALSQPLPVPLQRGRHTRR